MYYVLYVYVVWLCLLRILLLTISSTLLASPINMCITQQLLKNVSPIQYMHTVCIPFDYTYITCMYIGISISNLRIRGTTCNVQ